MKIEGPLLKMKTELNQPVQYHLPVGGNPVYMNDLIGKEVTLQYLNTIHCIRCGNVTKTSFAQGYCYPCFISAPETSECVLRPELCQAHEGISRDMEWSKEHCLQDHIVYLAITSGLKVGVTRVSQVPTRWIDQGAWKAIKLAQTPNRFTAGTIEVALKDHMRDKTNWRNMLTNMIPSDINLVEEKGIVEELLPFDFQEYISDDDEVLEIIYPIDHFPQKVRSINFDKTSLFSGTITGIKGQYLLFEDNSVLNIRKHGGYLVELDY